MVQRYHGLDVVGQQLVDEVIVVLYTQVVDAGPGTVRHHPGPGDGEPIMGHLEAAIQITVQ